MDGPGSINILINYISAIEVYCENIETAISSNNTKLLQDSFTGLIANAKQFPLEGIKFRDNNVINKSNPDYQNYQKVLFKLTTVIYDFNQVNEGVQKISDPALKKYFSNFVVNKLIGFGSYATSFLTDFDKAKDAPLKINCFRESPVVACNNIYEMLAEIVFLALKNDPQNKELKKIVKIMIVKLLEQFTIEYGVCTSVLQNVDSDNYPDQIIQNILTFITSMN
uniref:Uncharacterized protein n=1 Tax=Panagrolaimus sp. ES5 TaxID=591445 RepID=A0AC34FAY8_9BILA